jgi:hypothetical protein
MKDRVVDDRWQLPGGEAVAAGRAAVALILARLAAGIGETWFESDRGHLVAIVTNGERALVMLFRVVGDEGDHLVDPTAGDGSRGGYRLSNGQTDIYRDRDTVTLVRALEIVEAIVDGVPHPDAEWQRAR